MKLNLPQAVFMGSLDVRVSFAEVPVGMDSFLKSCNQQKRKGRYGFELIYFVGLFGYLFFFFNKKQKPSYYRKGQRALC